jgi:hypothetical protein
MRKLLITGSAALLAVLMLAPAGSAGTTRGRPQRGVAYRTSLLEQRRHQEMVANGVPHFARAAPQTAPRRRPAYKAVNVQQISRDELNGPSEDDTEVGPALAVDPNDPDVMVSVFMQGRFEDAGAAAIGFSSSQDGGVHWTAGSLPNLTVLTGGIYDRANTPAVAFGPDGSAYAVSVPFDNGDSSTVAVQRSGNQGRTWGDPVFPQVNGGTHFRPWITVDTFPTSPHFGRIYVTWELSLDLDTASVALRWSDDQGRTWSPLKIVSEGGSSDNGAQPLVQPNGNLTIVYQAFVDPDSYVVAKTSTDGGRHFNPHADIDLWLGSEPPDQRTGGLSPAAVDSVTGYLYAAWQDTRFRDDGLSDVLVYRSIDGGSSWTGPVKANPDSSGSGLTHFTPAIAAYGHAVHVTYLTRAQFPFPPVGYSSYVTENYVGAADDGTTFSGEITVGRPADLRYAATVFYNETKFLGEYMGIAATAEGAQLAWARSSPPRKEERYHQTTWSAEIVWK